MKIEDNEKEKEAMAAFHRGDRAAGLALQEEFVARFREAYANRDHGSCRECVAIHRAHQEHVPNCMRTMLNRKIRLLSELTEHTLANEIEPPHEVLRSD